MHLDGPSSQISTFPNFCRPHNFTTWLCSHEADHFAPQFGNLLRRPQITLPLPDQDWNEVLRPLSSLHQELLKLPNFNTLKREYCDKCTLFQIIDDLLFLDPLSESEHTLESDHQADFSVHFGRFTFGMAAVIALVLAWLT
jgi:hypothetical protein